MTPLELDTADKAAPDQRLRNRLGADKRYCLYPNAKNLSAFRQHLANR
jgi:hypothetical protein